MTTPDCYACSKEAEFDDLSPRECVVYDQHWRVAHAFNTAVPGWLVLLPRRHVAALHDLTNAEASALERVSLIGWSVDRMCPSG
ncbi:hypothetical protein ACFU5Y_06060 [Streptomyces gardneri]|uniref:hypothetical protein n=1 Tax=Streptomyces gardneri TaxID=66892 RepID=UPI0036AFB77D